MFIFFKFNSYSCLKFPKTCFIFPNFLFNTFSGRSRGRASGDAPSQAPGGQQKPPQAVVSRGPPGGPRPGPNAPVGRAGAPGPSRPGPAPVAGGRAMPPTAFSMPPAGRQQGKFLLNF